MTEQKITLTEDGLTAEVVRWYAEEGTGQPRQVVSNFYLCDPEEHPEAVELPGTPEGSWWLPSVPEPEGRERIGEAEYARRAAAWTRRVQREDTERKAAAERRAAAEREDREAARERVREDLSRLGLSEETVDILLRGSLPEDIEEETL